MPIPSTTVRTEAGATAGESVKQAPQPIFRLGGDILPVFLLVAINLVCFYRTLKGYFVADDFIHVTYLSKVCNGHPELLLQNFYSNWMQTHGTQFYRPLVSLSMAGDYWLGGGDATMFHVTNTILQIGSAVFLYLLTKRLLIQSPRSIAQIAAFTAAALFSAYPLHAEVVSWAIGRVDSLCTLFYLGAFWLFLKGKQDTNRAASILSVVLFALSCMSKEMAITLPATLSLYCLFEVSPGQRLTVKQRLLAAAHKTWPFWAALGVYFGIRILSLGTIFGGYSGAIGESMGNSFWKRWFQDGSLRRILFPLNIEVFSAGDKTAKQLAAVYGAAGALLAARGLLWKTHCGLSRYFFFALAWFVIAMAPTYNVWNLTENLQGSRFIYLGSAPLCLALALLLIPLAETTTRWRRYFSYAGVVCALALLALFVKVAYKDNLAWAHAFNHITDFRRALAQRVSELPADRKLVLLNVPQKEEGAHMLYNAAMLSILLSPPLTSPDISRRVISFEPMTYGFPDLIAPSRLRSLGAHAADYDFVSWNRNLHQLEKLQVCQTAAVPAVIATTSLNAELTAPGNFGKTAQLVSPRLNVPAMAYDTLRVRMKVAAQPLSGGKSEPGVYLFWSSEQDASFSPARLLSLPAVADGKMHDYVFHVSEHKSWLAANQIDRLQLELPFLAGQPHQVNGQPAVTVESIVLEPASSPLLVADAANLRADDDGVQRNLGWPIAFSVPLPAGAGALIEISKESSWFEHYSGTYRDDQASTHALKSIKLSSADNHIVLDRDMFPASGYYQVRAFFLDAGTGKVRGYSSDPINLQLTK